MPNPGKPLALKLLQGNPGKRALNKREPTATRSEPTMPSFLLPVAQEEWKRIVPILLELKVLTIADGSALADYCMSFARWKEAEALVSQHGVIVTEPVVNKAGDVVGTKLRKNPAATVAMAEKKEMRAALSLFGLDPSSRTRLTGGTEPQALSPLALLLREQTERRAAERASRATPVVPHFEI